MVYNPVISGLYTPARTDEMVYNPVISEGIHQQDIVDHAGVWV